VDALITGMHDGGTSHLQLMEAFCDKLVIERGYAEANGLGYRGREYGDLSLLM
jgi:S-adenosylmethionine:tRNA-ribosyltransferase-isomerase (queuine synthetase)